MSWIKFVAASPSSSSSPSSIPPKFRDLPWIRDTFWYLHCTLCDHPHPFSCNYASRSPWLLPSSSSSHSPACCCYSCLHASVTVNNVHAHYRLFAKASPHTHLARNFSTFRQHIYTILNKLVAPGYELPRGYFYFTHTFEGHKYEFRYTKNTLSISYQYSQVNCY